MAAAKSRPNETNTQERDNRAVRLATVGSAPGQGQTLHLQYLGALLMALALSLFAWGLRDQTDPVNIALLYQLPAILSAFWWGRWPSFFAAVISILLYDFLFMPPVFGLVVADLKFFWSFFSFLAVSLVIGRRTEDLKREAVVARQREKDVTALYDFSQRIAAVSDKALISQELAAQVAASFGRPTGVFLPDDLNHLVLLAHSPDGAGGTDPTAAGMFASASLAAVQETFAQAAAAPGDYRLPPPVPGKAFRFLPLIAGQTVSGVVSIELGGIPLHPEQLRLLEAWAYLAALAIERVKLAEKAREAELLDASDRLRTALLNATSHELRTPLAAVIGSVTTLLEEENLYSPAERRGFLTAIWDGATRMNQIVTNMLDIARLESGMVQLRADWCDLEDIVGAALRKLPQTDRLRQVRVELAPDLPLLRADCVLLEQVLVNLIDNALKYTPAAQPIEVTAAAAGDQIAVWVKDRGQGVPPPDLMRIFDKFYRVQQPQSANRGIGLGLSICKGIVEAHGGRIWAEARPGGGTSFGVLLPAGEGGRVK